MLNLHSSVTGQQEVTKGRGQATSTHCPRARKSMGPDRAPRLLGASGSVPPRCRPTLPRKTARGSIFCCQQLRNTPYAPRLPQTCSSPSFRPISPLAVLGSRTPCLKAPQGSLPRDTRSPQEQLMSVLPLPLLHPGIAPRPRPADGARHFTQPARVLARAGEGEAGAGTPAAASFPHHTAAEKPQPQVS